MSNTVKLNTCPKCSAPIPLAAPQGLCPRCVLLGAATATEQGVPATATSEIPSIERIAKAFPQFEVLELIGRGGMGFVFKARQPHLDRFVALKLLPDKLAKDAQFAERFNREGRVLARLNHPNIVTVFDFGQTGGFYYLLMEYVDGVNLRQAMRAGRFSPAEALSIVPKVCEALQYAHEQGILHRDIKPENLLLDAKGRVKIADFGIAKLVGEDQPSVTLTNTGAALGTLHYMAPEQLEKPSTVDHRADIYSLGVVFYEMLTGELPIGRFSAPSSKTPVNTSVDDVVFRTLEKDRERRFQSAGEMKTEVEHLGAGAAPSSTETEPSAPALPAPAWMKRLGVLFCVLGGLALLPTLFSLGSNARVYHSGTLLAFTGVALLTRHGQWRMAAIVANLIGLVMPLASAINVMILSRNGTLPPGWSLGIPGIANGAGLAVALSLVQTVAFAIGLWVLLRPAAKPHFLAASYVPMGRVYSWWVIAGTALVGMSLPQPLSVIVSILTGRAGVGPADFWAALGNVAMPGLGGTLIGWLALNKIRESGGRERGLPLAMFATLTWPLILLGALVLGLPMLIVSRGERTLENMVGRFLVLLLPVGVIGFGVWLAQATKRWAGRKPAPHERGLLKWAFIAAVVAGMGVVMVAGPKRTAPGQPAPTAPEVTDAAPWIRFTFTAVELREVKGVRWLAIDYLDDVHGECQKAFPWETDIPGFKAETRTTEFRTDAKDSSPAVRHQRIEYRMPDTSPREQLERLRDNLEKALKQKSFRLALGENEAPLLLFELPGVEGGSLKARIKVVPPLRIPEGATAATAAAPSVNQPEASAESWTPSFAPGEKPVPSKILQEAASLAQQGQYEQALQRHLWYHHHALEFQPSQAGVRLSFAVMQWMDLARRYPQAKDALVEIRNQDAREFSSSGGSFRDFVEVSFINKALGEDHATVALFKTVQERNPKLARQCYQFVEDLLVETGEYAHCVRFIPDAQERFGQICAKREKMLEEARDPKSAPELLRKVTQQTFIKETRTLVEVLVGVGRKPEAEEIRDQAVALVDVPELRSAVADAEEKVAKHSAVPRKP